VVGINFGLVLLVLLAAEVIFGSWFFGPSYSDLNLPRNTVRYFDVSAMYPGGSIAVYRRDRHGLRGAYDDPSRIDILTIGGSTTNELYISEGATWPDRLAENFARAGRPLTVVNAGVDGQSTVGLIRNFDVWFPLIPSLKARYILAYVGINDMALGEQGADEHGTKFDAMKSPSLARRWRHYVRNHSVLYDVFRKVRGAVQARAAKVDHQIVDYAALTWSEVDPSEGREALEAALARRLARYRERLFVMVERIRTFGAEPILVSQHQGFYRRDGNRVLFVESAKDSRVSFLTLTLFNRTTLAVCRETGALCVDLGGQIEFQPGDFYDYVHTTPQGSKRVADFLFDRLKHHIQ
jgi:lysophospholipase L1-like esterase